MAVSIVDTGEHPQSGGYTTKRTYDVLCHPILSIEPGWVLIVAGGLLQVPAVQAAHELGYKVLLTDRNPNCACASLVEEFVELDTFDVQGHIDLANTWSGLLAAVFTAGADPVVTVAAAAEVAGCYGLPLKIARNCVDKSIAREKLATAGVPQPSFEYCFDVDDLQGEGRWCDEKTEIEMLIVKATLSSGSRGHTIILPSDLANKDNAQAVLEKACAFSGLNGEILVEEYLTGVELSVETLWYNGAMLPLNAVERPFRPNTCIELGHYNPAQLSQEDYQAVWNIMRQAGDAIGMNTTTGGHILKGDLIMTTDGPKVLELTPRLSGGFDSANTTPASRGCNYIKGALRLALGQPLEQAIGNFLPRWHKHSVCLAVFSPQGKVKAIHGAAEARALGEVILRYEVGDDVPELVDCTQRAGFVIATDDTQAGALKRAESMLGMVEYEVEE